LALSIGSSPKSSFEGNNIDNGSTIKIYHTTAELNIDAFKKYEESYTTSDEDVKRIHVNMGNQTFFEVIDRFLHEEFWSYVPLYWFYWFIPTNPQNVSYR